MLPSTTFLQKQKHERTRKLLARAYPLRTTVWSSYSARKMRCRPWPPPVEPSSSMALTASYSFSRRRGRSIPAMLTSCTTCLCFSFRVLFCKLLCLFCRSLGFRFQIATCVRVMQRFSRSQEQVFCVHIVRYWYHVSLTSYQYILQSGTLAATV